MIIVRYGFIQRELGLNHPFLDGLYGHTIIIQRWSVIIHSWKWTILDCVYVIAVHFVRITIKADCSYRWSLFSQVRFEFGLWWLKG